MFLAAKRHMTTIFLEQHESDKVQVVVDAITEQTKKGLDEVAVMFLGRVLANDKVTVKSQKIMAWCLAWTVLLGGKKESIGGSTCALGYLFVSNHDFSL